MSPRDDLTGTVAALEGGARDTAAFLRARVHEQPFVTLLAGGFAGWVLGGGLTPRAMAFLAQMAGRTLGATALAAVVHGAEAPRAPRRRREP